MGESTAPEIDIPMPEIPGPETVKTPLVGFFPFGVVNHILFSTVDALLDGSLWPSETKADKPQLWHFFPFGPPAQMILELVDLVYSVVVERG